MHTFVIRLYRPNTDALQNDGRLRGVVEEVSTGFETTFHSTAELLSILRRQRAEPAEV